ncbi:DCL family protein [Solirubrobacter ginsenosidimutans]|uniref:DCL family protein n=1 Tax=Solirubrobacter ginsenosidimutans TaxID=490573 RepID=A0A9X3S5U5_9ACTN|nr:DCL family protein [Solirubrobacter ginsenosidimutans]MDA0167144.1 DCL family protein [Solirubrobacter ginsenosidimutans]
MSRIPVVIGQYQFATKTDARAYVSDMLDRYVDGQRIESDDEQFLCDLLDLHPEAVTKIGCGVSHFTREADRRGGRCFWLWRTDGTHNDWSTAKALRLTGPRHDLLGAMRCEVEDQRNDFVREQFADRTTVICAITGVPLTKEAAHADHADPTFGQMARNFLAEEGIGTRLPPPQITDAGTRRYFSDRDLARRWKSYHRDHAVLRLTTAHANLARKRGPRAPTP